MFNLPIEPNMVIIQFKLSPKTIWKPCRVLLSVQFSLSSVHIPDGDTVQLDAATQLLYLLHKDSKWTGDMKYIEQV